MKTSKYNIICSRILLTCFIVGQVMIYAHQHNTLKSTSFGYNIPKSRSPQTVSEKCQLCDVMHHNNNMVAATLVYASPADASAHVFKAFEYDFTSIQLILSCGRAPPYPAYS